MKHNILLIASWWKSKDSPTSGSFIEEQARMLLSAGHSVVVVHPFLKGTFRGTLQNRETVFTHKIDEDLEVYEVGVSPALPGFRSMSYSKLFKKVLPVMEEIIQREKIDLIHAHSMFCGGVIGLKASKKFQLPFIHTEHTSGLIFAPQQYNRSDKKLIRKVFQESDKVLFVSIFALTETLKTFKVEKGENHEVLGNLIDESFFVRNDEDEQKYSCINISRLNRVKNIGLTLEAWKIVLNQFPKARLRIIGKGVLEKELKQHALSLQIQNSVEWIGEATREEVSLFIQKSQVLVSTSKLETFGMTVAEAMASGKPVVVTDSGGIRDFVCPPYGKIVSSNPEEVAKGIIAYFEHESNQLSLERSKFIRSKFSANVILPNLESIYFKFSSK